ncbi:MAG TPA: chromate efflux transporter [Thermoanaerobaculia bacterium]|nr:chromate efflux transporter [Thermoanaerobaculia bacterium]
MSSRIDSSGTSRLLRELAWVFLRLGTTSFGGPAAHIALMEDEAVRRRKWVSREEFLDLLGATNLIPGPNSTELAIHLGHRLAGWPGLLVAGASFIAPAMLIVGAIAWAYGRFAQLPQADAVLYGIKPVVIAIVVQALAGLARTAARTVFLAAVGLVSVALLIAGVHELAVLLIAGLVALAARALRSGKPRSGALALLAGLPSAGGAAAAGAPAVGLLPLFLFFLKVGSVLFGSGYVLLAFLRADLVERWHWLTERQLLDAIAIGQVTPGPVFTTATFIGYLLRGFPGALIATLGIFLPAFVFVALSGPLVPKLRASPVFGALLDGVNVGSLALMAVVTVQLGRSALVDPATVLLAAASAFLLIRYRVSSAWLILGGGMAGFALRSLLEVS